MGRLRAAVDRAALQAGVRAAVAVSAGFAIGRYALDDVQFAVFAAFTAMALLVFADFGGPVPARLGAVAATLAVAVALTALGTAVSESPWGAPLTVGLVAVAVAFAAVLGGYFVAGVNAVVLFVVLAAGIPVPEDALGPRVAGVLVGGALSAAATALMWPARPAYDPRPALARAAAALGACLRAADPGAPLEAATREVRAARARLGDAAHRPAEPTAPHRALLRLVFDLDRLLGRIAGTVRQGGAPPPAAGGFVAIGADGLDAAAASLAGGRPPHDPPALEARLAAAIPRARARLAAEAPSGTPAALAAHVQRTAIAAEVAEAAGRAAFDAEVAAGRRPRTSHPAIAGLLDEPVRTVAARRLRTNLTLRSPHLRSALRLGAALALAMALVQALDLEHGFWVVLATLTVVRSTAASTGVAARLAVLGTAVGFAVSVPLIFAAERESHLYVASLAVVIVVAVYAARTGGLVAGQAAFTVLVVVLFGQLAPADWTLALVRVEDVVAGALVGVLIGLVAWPHGAGRQLPGAVAELIERGTEEVRSAVRRILGAPPASGADPAALRAASLTAARRAEDVLAVALAERRAGPDGADPWPAILADAGQLWYSAWWIVDLPYAGPPPPGCPALRAALLARADAAADHYGTAAEALRRRDRPPAPPPPADDDASVDACVRANLDPSRSRGAMVRLLVARHWVREVEAGAERFAARVSEAASPGRAARRRAGSGRWGALRHRLAEAAGQLVR